MTDKEFKNAKFKGYQEIIFKMPRTEEAIPCMLIAIDWDKAVLTLIPFFNDTLHEIEFHARINDCFFPKPKLKVLKSKK